MAVTASDRAEIGILSGARPVFRRKPPSEQDVSLRCTKGLGLKTLSRASGVMAIGVFGPRHEFEAA